MSLHTNLIGEAGLKSIDYALKLNSTILFLDLAFEDNVLRDSLLLNSDLRRIRNWPARHSIINPEWQMSIEIVLVCLKELCIPEDLATVLIRNWGMATKIISARQAQKPEVPTPETSSNSSSEESSNSSSSSESFDTSSSEDSFDSTPSEVFDPSANEDSLDTPGEGEDLPRPSKRQRTE